MLAKLVAFSLLIFVSFTDIPNIQAVMCPYELSESGVYSCNLLNQTILTESDMDTATGTHMPGFSDDNVTLLLSFTSIIEIFPSRLIDRFVNLNTVLLLSVDLQRFTSSITNCERLLNVLLLSNRITSVPGNIFQNCRQLTDFKLNSNRISHMDNAAFTGLTQLKRLSLSDNYLSFLDPAIFLPIRNLEVLNLDNNLIGNERAETFGQLSLLTNLTLNANNITTWSSTFHNSSQALQQLRLDRNEISSISGDTFANLPQLKTLYVGDLIDELPVFNGLGSLEELWLMDNKLKVVSADSFRNLVSLHRLDLSFNNIESVTLAPAFTMLTNLDELSLRRNRIEFLSVESIRPIAQLRRLDVSFNLINRIEREIFTGVTNLTFLSQRNVCFDGDVSITSSDDFEHRVAALLEPCFNFSVSSVRTNTLLLVGAVIFTKKFF